MKTFLKVWSILLLVIGGLETLPLLTALTSSSVNVGQAILVGMPILVESITVLVYLGRENREV